MIILEKIISIDELGCLEEKTFFSDMSRMKAVVDIEREILAVNAELHSDLEQMLLENGSNQRVADPKAREKIVEVVNKWIKQ